MLYLANILKSTKKCEKMVKYRKKKKVVLPKTRKELRKEKRLKKKENKRQFFSQQKKSGEFVRKLESKTELEENVDSEIIESDFELSDEEVKSQLNKVSKNTASVSIKSDRFHENQEREKKKQQELQKMMRKRRIEQLKTANEEDDKIIRKLGKKLKIDKHKSDKSVPKMFSDGLDYALELCLPENIEKMYSAAKEAAELEDSEDEFEEDIAIALGKDTNKNEKGKPKSKEQKKKSTAETKKTKQSKLSKIERKYFKNDLESDLSGSDSEFQDTDNESTDGDKSSKKQSKIKEHDVDDDKSEDSAESQEEDYKEDEEDVSDDFPEDENSNIEDSFSEDDEEESDKPEKKTESASDKDDENNKIWEDIYGRKRDNEGNVLQVNI